VGEVSEVVECQLCKSKAWVQALVLPHTKKWILQN
jgi:hypothetical protein